MNRKVACLGISLLLVILGTNWSAEAQVDPAIIVGLWDLNEGDGDIATDISGNARDGNIQNAEWDDGQQGKALGFEKGDTVEVVLGEGIIKDKVSIVLWLKFIDMGGQQNYFSIWDSSDHRYVPYKTDGHELRFWSNNWNVGSGFTVKKDTWYHVANVDDGADVSIYVDGELKITQGGAFELTDNNQSSWFATDKGGWLSACMEDEIGIFSDALSANEIRSIMEEGIGWALNGSASVDPFDKAATTWAQLRTQR